MQESKEKVLENKILSQINKVSNTIGIELTTFCPLDCIYCTRKINERCDQNLSMEKFEELYKKIENYERVVICGIGEPFVYPHLYEVLERLKDKRVVLITSGSVKIDFEKLKHGNCIEVMIFSVDSPTEEGMKKIASTYNWENLQYNLSQARGFTRIINCTITEENIKDLTSLVQFAAEKGLSAISFTMDIRRVENGEYREDVNQILLEAKKIAQKNRVFFMDNSTNFKCLSWSNLVNYINLKGDFFPCCHGVNSKYVCGNIFESSISEILESEKMQAFKKGHLCFSNCKIFDDCCKLHDLR
ncbi:radical SAM protein [Blautia liquoris]|jgi:MoaA/NifB/PqqE/SkfB family radical SAM enzyme|uniref:Radical SAM protein n=1 Tax=Blautia liquoris TaxID=2779518 RepID=A0A7M2RGS0_9FIRM|nr:radical SAM protein [Blautia liquoris]QOV19214.1 radical SAM protein [Blautia liquoris]